MYLKDRVRKAIRYKDDINPVDIENIKHIRTNPICTRMLQSYSENGKLDFDQMFTDLHSYVTSKDIKTKLKILFKIYDTDRDGYVTKVDLYEIIKGYSECNNEKQIMDIVNATFQEAGAFVEKMDYKSFSSILLQKSLNLKKLLKC